MRQHPNLEAVLRVGRGAAAAAERRRVLRHCRTCRSCGDDLAIVVLLRQEGSVQGVEHIVRPRSTGSWLRLHWAGAAGMTAMAGMIALAVTVSAGILVAACGPAPLVFSDWTIPVPEGTRIIGYAGVSDEDRTGSRIAVQEDLVISPQSDDDNYSFYRPLQVLADSAGRISVVDGGNARVQVFDAGGEYLRTLGGPGGGPGEFQQQGGWVTIFATVAADRMIAYDAAQSRISTWGPDGAHIGDHVITDIRFGSFFEGLENGNLLSEITERTEENSYSVLIAASSAGERLVEYLRLPRPGNLTVGRLGIANPTGGPEFAAAGDGNVYATAGDEYQVLAIGPDGETRWALRVAQERPPFTDEHRARVLEVVTRNFPDLDASATEWPTHLGSIGRLAVDGHGHLYVFGVTPPFTSVQEENVDVYAADGERLFTGTMPVVRWTAAAGDFVYALRTNEESGEQEAVRYRLVEPFE